MLIQINWLGVCHTEKEKKNNKSLDIIIYVMYTRVCVTPRVVGEHANLRVRYGKNEGYFLIWQGSKLKLLTSWSSEL